MSMYLCGIFRMLNMSTGTTCFQTKQMVRNASYVYHAFDLQQAIWYDHAWCVLTNVKLRGSKISHMQMCRPLICIGENCVPRVWLKTCCMIYWRDVVCIRFERTKQISMCFEQSQCSFVESTYYNWKWYVMCWLKLEIR